MRRKTQQKCGNWSPEVMIMVGREKLARWELKETESREKLRKWYLQEDGQMSADYRVPVCRMPRDCL